MRTAKKSSKLSPPVPCEQLNKPSKMSLPVPCGQLKTLLRRASRNTEILTGKTRNLTQINIPKHQKPHSMATLLHKPYINNMCVSSPHHRENVQEVRNVDGGS